MADDKKWTVSRIAARKGNGKIVSLTAYDYAMARWVDAAGIHLIIVGDSLGMTVLGYESTIPVTMNDMLHHTRAVARGAERALIVADMPFLSYQVSVEEAVDNAGRLVKDGRADAVKIEGGAHRKPVIEALLQNGIPVMGHIGLTPQSVRAFGGYKVQGRSEEAARQLIDDARALEEAGVFSLVVEGVPADLGQAITEAVGVPTVGIGAGPHCDGQVLVLHDVLGLSGDFKPKFVKRYADLGPVVDAALKQYRKDVEQGRYPDEDHSY